MRNKRTNTNKSSDESARLKSTGESDYAPSQSADDSKPFSSMNAADMLSQYKNASLEFGPNPGSSDGDASSLDLTQGTKKLAQELEEFVTTKDGGEAAEATGDAAALSDDAIADLQLQTARKLRELLPTNKDLLRLAQERNWIPLLLGWLNLHDRPEVQVEALLALTNIAELSSQQSYYQHTHSSSSTSSVAAAAREAAAAAQVAAAKAKALSSKISSNSDSTTFPPTSDTASSSAPSGSGSVPFPPLSFSQSLTPEAMAAVDASLSWSIQQTKGKSGSSKSTAASSGSLGLSSLSSSLSQTLQSPGISPGSLSFGLGPPIGHSSSSYLPPPTPVSTSGSDGSTCLPQLSASSLHLLLRHADAIPTLISLLSSPNREVYFQAMWILGSIAAGDPTTGSSGSSKSDREKSVAARDVILAAGIMNQLLRCLEAHPTDLSLQRVGSWTLSNLVEGIFQQPSHGKSSKSSDYSSSDEIDMSTLLPVLRRLLRSSDSEVLSYTCWTLSHLCDGPSSHIAAVVTTADEEKAPKGGLVPRLVELLVHPSWRVTKPALRTIGNIVCAECSDDNNHSSSSSSSSSPTDYTEIILYCGAVPRLMELVTHSNREIQKEACWTLSNVAAGTVDQIQAVIDSGAIPPLVKLVSDKKTEQEVRSEACWVVLNATSCGNDSQIEVLVKEGCVSVLGVLLDEPSMVMMALEGLERVLQVEETRETARREKRKKEGKGDKGTSSPVLVSAKLIEKALDKHNSSAVTKRANRIWKQHFVSCALCNESFSKHRTADATFCEECKCYVCSKCDCKVYHLSYQEELWAASEEKTEAKKNAKKSKNKKKKQKQKKARQASLDSQASTPTRGETVTVDAPPTGKFPSQNESSVETGSRKSRGDGSSTADDGSDKKDAKNASFDEGVSFDDSEDPQPPIDFVLYLQQTGSIIALAKLMDALDYGDGNEYNMEELDDKELQLFRNLQHQQATN